ncbi:MAG: hypothetical protein BWY73_01464 [candidate division TA06 bacterium ADurb.Bin417]|uniref:Uncharacterized protein n=1 Tax=candidate division TA06 bacterium ADurb.Bin417 TaxID=1852828 RepID=A0A1V5M907_UNCT6|nr:MAG: hypothetical protein BWY73_01464 [candidate division TA06 bacterium ADurb.Bin417]
MASVQISVGAAAGSGCLSFQSTLTWMVPVKSVGSSKLVEVRFHSGPVSSGAVKTAGRLSRSRRAVAVNWTAAGLSVLK